MAHSIQIVGEKNEIFNDGDLLILLRMMIEEIKKNVCTYRQLKPFAVQWEDQCDYRTLGSIEMDLEVLVKEPRAKSEFLMLLCFVERKVREFGEKIPGDILNKRWRIPGIIYGDLKTHYLVSAIQRIRALVTE